MDETSGYQTHIQVDTLFLWRVVVVVVRGRGRGLRRGFGGVEVEEEEASQTAQHHPLDQPRHLRSPHAAVVDVEGEHRHARRQAHEADGDPIVHAWWRWGDGEGVVMRLVERDETCEIDWGGEEGGDWMVKLCLGNGMVFIRFGKWILLGW